MTSRGVCVTLIFVVLMVCCGCGTILGVSDKFEPRNLPDDVVMDTDAQLGGYALPSDMLNNNRAPAGDGGSIPALNNEPFLIPQPAINTTNVDLGPAVDPDAWEPPGSLNGPSGMPPIPGLAATVVDDRTWQPVYFAYNQDFIGDAGQRQLEQLADYLSRNGAFHVVVEGHCDERGSEGYNRSLGERRAIAVMNYLVALGVPDGRLKSISYGEERPASSGAGEAVWRQNRRAEIIVVSPR